MPQLWVIAGPNGSGKTTVADRWFASRIPVVSPDSIAAELANFTPAFEVADRSFALDNSALRPRLILSWENGRIRQRSSRLPQWALDAFPSQLLTHMAQQSTP